jgi:hypothetical protein
MSLAATSTLPTPSGQLSEPSESALSRLEKLSSSLNHFCTWLGQKNEELSLRESGSVYETLEDLGSQPQTL